MTDTQQYAELEASIDIDAPPAQVWALVTDVPRMASWSPQVVRTKVKGGVVRQGATFSNLNRQGLLFWPTAAKVVRFEPHRDFAFRIKENGVVWSFQLALRSRGLGSVLATALAHRAEEVAEVLGLPADCRPVTLVPVGYTVGLDFRPAVRGPVVDVVRWNAWSDADTDTAATR